MVLKMQGLFCRLSPGRNEQLVKEDGMCNCSFLVNKVIRSIFRPNHRMWCSVPLCILRLEENQPGSNPLVGLPDPT